MKNVGNQQLDKWLGAILGAAVGDALGWPNEQNSRNVSKVAPPDKNMFQKWIRRDGGQFWSHQEEIFPGEYSDDTQLLIATARSLQHGSDWHKTFANLELPAWVSYERGGGGATKRAANCWKKNSRPWNLEKEKKADVERYFNAGGNGVAMRILPHVMVADGNWNQIAHHVFLNGIYTHGHPRALVGALVYADALLYLLQNKKTLGYGELVEYLLDRKHQWGELPNAQNLDNWLRSADTVIKGGYRHLWAKVVDEVTGLLAITKDGLAQGALDMGSDVLDKLGCFNKKVNGAGSVTAVAAIYLASKYASSPQMAIVDAAHLEKADTDTLASMVGGLVGILHGQKFLPSPWFAIQDYEYIKKLIQFEPSKVSTDDAPLFDYSNQTMKTQLKELDVGGELTVKPLGKLVLKDKRLNKSNVKGVVIHTLKLLSEEGQTIFLKTFEKGNVAEISSQPERRNTPQNGSQTKEQLKIDYDKPVGIQGPLLDSLKIRRLANIFPETMQLKFDMCIQVIGDVMDLVQRHGARATDPNNLDVIGQRWSRHGLETKDLQKLVRLILEK